MNLSIIIPAYNAEQFIQDNIRNLLNQFNSSEIIVINDGSIDKTLEKLETFGNKIKLINHPKNFGKGAAIRSGFLASTGEIVIFTDADLPYGIDNVIKLYQRLQNSSDDIVIGYRHCFQEGFIRHLTHLAINMIIQLLF